MSTTITRTITKHTDLERLSDFDKARQSWFETQQPVIIEIEIITIDAFCDCCSAQQTATREQLIQRGWYCGTREQFCPTCNI